VAHRLDEDSVTHLVKDVDGQGKYTTEPVTPPRVEAPKRKAFPPGMDTTQSKRSAALTARDQPRLTSPLEKAAWAKALAFATVVLLVTFVAPRRSFAAAGDLDPSFGSGGTVQIAPPAGCDETAGAVRRQGDGKLLAAGVECAQAATRDFLVVRVLGDGSLDPSFGQGGRVTTDIATTAPPQPCGGCVPPIISPADDGAADVVLQSDGRIVAGGYTTSGGGGTNFALVRYLSGGALDQTFGAGGRVITDVTAGADDSISALLLQGDGKIVAVGRTGDHLALVRYRSDGTLDPNFGAAGIVTTTGVIPYAAALDPNGKMIVAGTASTIGPFDLVVARYLPDGTLDPGFGAAGVVTTDLGTAGDAARAVVLQSDGKIVVAGESASDSASTFALVRYQPDGTLDPTFGQGGRVVAGPPYASGRSVAVQGDGRIVVGGFAWISTWAGDEIAIARYLPNGQLDSDFGHGGVLTTDATPSGEFASSVVLQPDDKLVAAGTGGNGIVLARYLLPSNTTPPATSPPTTTLPMTPPPVTPPRSGYWMVGSDGAVYAFGDARSFGNAPTAASAVDLEPTPSGSGYWVVDDLGRVFTFGDAPFHGNVDQSKLAVGEKVTSLSATKSGNGYWIFTSRGRVLTFGDAPFLGDVSTLKLNGPVLDSITTLTGLGYYMVASDGGVFNFGDAKLYGSMGAAHLNAPVQSLVPDSDGVGYWLVASDGGIFAFDAGFKGSLGATRLNKPVTGMVRSGTGYLMVGEDGGIFDFSGTPDGFKGSLGAKPPANPIVSVAVLEDR
jgi:uncharacterized delta-60 repeat protein